MPNCADRLVVELCDRGVEDIFCITGAGNLAIVDAILRDGRIKLTFAHHEQAAVMAAQGYARTKDCVGVALVTTGGGAANALTGALSANLDSIPILLISGNESSFHCEDMRDFRAFGVQGFDSTRAFESVSKSSERIQSPEQTIEKLARAWKACSSGRPGVSFLDFPMDIQRSALPSQPETDSTHEDVEQEWDQPSISNQSRMCAEEFHLSERPLVYIGNGLRNEAELALALKWLEDNSIPFILSWSAVDLVKDSHRLNMGRVGIYGDRAANLILQRADLLLCLGTRLSIPQMGYDRDDFARGAKRWVVDIDAIELTKFKGPRWSLINAPISIFLREFLSEFSEQREVPTSEAWLETCRSIWQSLPRELQTGPEPEESGVVHSSRVMEALNECLPETAVVVTDVGAGLLSGHYSLRPNGRQRVFTSQGLGEMGFGLPGAIGAAVAAPNRQVVCLSTDGGIMFNLQELQTIVTNRLAIKVFIFNNAGYSMIRISQDNLFSGRRIGVDPETGIGFPDFKLLAEAFGLNYYALNSRERLHEKLDEIFNDINASIIEVMMSPNQRYLPRLATRKLPDGSLSSPPLEDLDPPLDLKQLQEYLGELPHENSHASRGIAREK